MSDDAGEMSNYLRNNGPPNGVLSVMGQQITGLLIVAVITSCGRSLSGPRMLSMCELSREFGAYRDTVVAVRAVYNGTLHQYCPAKCADGPLPSFVSLIDSNESEAAALYKALRTVQFEAKKGKRFEMTAIGRPRTLAPPAPLRPCDKVANRYAGYGHLGVAPAELVVFHYKDIEVRENPDSRYDYSHAHTGAR